MMKFPADISNRIKLLISMMPNLNTKQQEHIIFLATEITDIALASYISGVSGCIDTCGEGLKKNINK